MLLVCLHFLANAIFNLRGFVESCLQTILNGVLFLKSFFDREKRSGSGPKNGKVFVVVIVVLGYTFQKSTRIDKN